MAMPLSQSHGYATPTARGYATSTVPRLCHFHCPMAMPLPLPHGYATPAIGGDLYSLYCV